MPLPPIFLYERHWDRFSKKAYQALLLALHEEGYDTLCLETPKRATEEAYVRYFTDAVDDLLESHNIIKSYLLRANKALSIEELADIPFTILSELMRQCVSTKYYEHHAHNSKILAARQIEKEIIINAIRQGWFIEGVDNPKYDFIYQGDIRRPYSETTHEKVDPVMLASRNQYMWENLKPLMSKRKGIVFICGFQHTQYLQNQLNAAQIPYIDVFAHSSLKYYSEGLNDFTFTPDLEQIKIRECVINPKQADNDIQSFITDILEQIKLKNTIYLREIPEGNSTLRHLQTSLNKPFTLWERSGHHVDAILVDDEDKRMIKKFKKHNLSFKTHFHNGKNQLVIENVNHTDVAKKILKL